MFNFLNNFKAKLFVLPWNGLINSAQYSFHHWVELNICNDLRFY